MDNRILIDSKDLPFCKGCGHAGVAQNTEKALQKLGYDTLDVIFVTDIGCHGIIDKSLRSHTVHGLHGRSVALAGGIAAGLTPESGKKVIVFIGDGGATIGMQHLLVAAHHNFPMTVVIHNNMLYGMTGGQPSEFTPCGFNTPTAPNRSAIGAIDMVKLMEGVGTAYVSRVSGVGDFSDELAEAFAQPGFSLVEVMEICPSYGVKSNPGMKLKQVVETAGLAIHKSKNPQAENHRPVYEGFKNSLLSDKLTISKEFEPVLKGTVRILLSGSAGEGTQSAAEFLVRTAMLSGLYATKKGHYPVTVGVGFSAAEVIISDQPIFYTGSTKPDYMLITSADGLDYSMPKIKNSPNSVILLDSSLPQPDTKAKIIQKDLRSKVGARNAAMLSVFTLIKKFGILSEESLLTAYSRNKLSAKVPVETFTSNNHIGFKFSF